jgi:C-terminal processing protease CtpA/Prc
MSLQNSTLQSGRNCKAAIKAHVGIGLSDGCVVESLLEDFPAHKSGIISVGDRLLAVQGRDVTACTPEDAQLALSGNQVKTILLRESTLVLLSSNVSIVAGRSCGG